MNYFKNTSLKVVILFVVILILSLFSRLYLIGSVPSGMNNDEAAYVYSAYSIWQTHGYALEGSRFPLSINVNGNDLSPVPVYITAPFVGMLGLSPFTARLPFVLLSIGSIVLTFFIAQRILKNEEISLLSMFTLSVSPWHMFISRSATDAVVALFFFLLGIWLFLRETNKHAILFSLPAFLLAFYSYHATKVFFVFLIPVLLYFYKDDLLKIKKQLVLFVIGIAVILLSFVAITRTQGVIRQNILVWNDPNKIKEATSYVNTYREQTTASLKVSSVYTNKLLFFGHEIAKNYLGAFSPQYLFISGDSIPFTAYNMFFWGELYLIELPFLILGVASLLVMKNKKGAYLLLSLVAISATPSALPANTSYIIRSVMMTPFLSILIGVGLYQLMVYIKRTSIVWKAISSIGISLLYVFFISLFFYQYFFQFAVFGGDFWYASSKEMAVVVKKEQQNHMHVLVGIKEKIILLKLGIYLSLRPEELKTVWNNNGSGDVGGMSIHKDCLARGQGNPYDLIPSKTAYIVAQDCYTNIEPVKKISTILNGQDIIWKVYEKR